jgi:hypothetical protein
MAMETQLKIKVNFQRVGGIWQKNVGYVYLG